MRVFISHSSARDRPSLVGEVRELLQREGIEIWEMSDAIKGGKLWGREIGSGVKASDWILVIVSESAVGSKWVYREISLADKRDKAMIPLLADDTEPSAVHPALVGIQHVDATKSADDWQADLLRALVVKAAGGGAAPERHTRVRVSRRGRERAPTWSAARRRLVSALVGLAVLCAASFGAWRLLVAPGCNGPSPIDRTAPTLEITDPPTEESTFQIPVKVVHGKATDKHLAKILKNGAEIGHVNGVFDVVVELREGQVVTLAFEAVDEAGNRSAPQHRVLRYEPPLPGAPAALPWRVPLDLALEYGKAGDWARAAVLLRTAKEKDAPAFEIPAQLEEGIAAYEAPPSLVVTSPAEGAEVIAGLIQVRGTLSTGRTSDRVFVAGVEAKVERGVFAQEVRPDGPGATTITVLVRDGDQERARVVRRVVVVDAAAESADVPSWAKVSKDQRAEAKRLGVPVAFKDPKGMRFVLIPRGTFKMGSPATEEDRRTVEVLHVVTITQSFYLATTETTEKVWQAVMGGPVYGSAKTAPKTEVSWEDCQSFLQRLNEIAPGAGYRLPTEAEWEYACRATTTTQYWSGDEEQDLKRVGWYGDNSGLRAREVGKLPPSEWGLYDMHGNVYEWCQDIAAPLSEEAATDPRVVGQGSRIIRGGSWLSVAAEARSAMRGWAKPEIRNGELGFRIARSVTTE